MKVQRDSGWMRRGVSLLWDASELSKVVSPNDVVSLRKFFAMAKAWPDNLPSGGDALVVAGVEGCLDALTNEDGAKWLEGDLKQLILGFQEEYEGQAALILWLPSGRRRITMVSATEQYFWTSGTQRNTPRVAIGQCLWAGAESDAARIIVSKKRHPDFDGDAYVGLYHPRIS